MMTDHESIKVFISYAHEDDHLRADLTEELGILGIPVWADREITAGTEWDDEIQRELESADIILLLISRDFLSSEFVREHEMPRALARHAEKSAKVVPVLVRPVSWEHLPISKLNAIPADSKWMTGADAWNSIDEAIRNVAQSVRRLVTRIRKERADRLAEQQKAEEDYRREVAEALSDLHISEIERDTLEDARKRLGLSADVAKTIEAGELQPLEKKRQSIASYEASVIKALDLGGYPFAPDLRVDLDKRQAKLGLTDEDIAGLEARVATRHREQREAGRSARKEADRKAKEEADRLAKEEADRKAKDEADRKAKAAATRKAKADTARKANQRVEAVSDALAGFAEMPDVFVGDSISDKKRRNAHSKCGIPDDEVILAIVDCTVLGSAKDCWAFTEQGLYYHHVGDRHHLTYDELKDLPVEPKGMLGVGVGPHITLSINGSAVSKKQGAEILDGVKKRL